MVLEQNVKRALLIANIVVIMLRGLLGGIETMVIV